MSVRPSVASQTAAVCDPTFSRRILLFAALICAVYILLHIAVNGIVLDEAVETAQNITGSIRYLSGHPDQPTAFIPMT